MIDKEVMAKLLSRLITEPKMSKEDLLNLNKNDFVELINKFSEEYDLWFKIKIKEV